MESKKLSLKNLFTVEKQNNGETKRIDLWTRGGQSEMYGKSNVETYITICKRDSQREFAVWIRNSNRGSVSI